MNTWLTWTENGQTRQARWHQGNGAAIPKKIVSVDAVGADKALTLMHAQTALLWRGDYHQAKQLLAAIKKRVRGKNRVQNDFHRYRMQQAQQSRLFQLLLLEVNGEAKLSNPRAPSIADALRDAGLNLPNEPFLLPLHLLLGYIGAYEWHKQGIAVAALDQQTIHVPFGVFSPIRGEYIDLTAQAVLPNPCRTAWDIGTGSGVLAAVLVRRGVQKIIATDINPRALAAANANIERLGLTGQVAVQAADLFPVAAAKADLIVCNPPWLPAKPAADIETALYDPQHAMLQAFLNGASGHLTESGQVWLIMSDLAEHLGLRSPDALQQWFQAAGLQVIARSSIRPSHPKTQQTDNPLHAARMQETTTLWQLTRI
ncbi:methyltransferase [Stenoxybacter acetivorans]|uniref:methyltransferase n=1 Tax=Stenoxybacter acetivorans TaxID=422441 RepID=UPI00056D14AD|nr:class I SAM-dependent methyltransferase [Stenoxybacter acetivorans]